MLSIRSIRFADRERTDARYMPNAARLTFGATAQAFPPAAPNAAHARSRYQRDVPRPGRWTSVRNRTCARRLLAEREYQPSLQLDQVFSSRPRPDWRARESRTTPAVNTSANVVASGTAN